MTVVPPIVTDRLSLVVLDAEVLTAMDRREPSGRFTWPSGWPDGDDVGHVAMWREQAPGLDGRDAWRPRAMVVVGGHGSPPRMVGHAGFHQPPQSIEAALSDPTFRGTVAPSAAGVVEIGYTVFPAERGRGYATEVGAALLDWVFATGEVSTVLATTAVDNDASMAVLQRIGGFSVIGRCHDGDGTVELVLRRDLTPTR